MIYKVGLFCSGFRQSHRLHNLIRNANLATRAPTTRRILLVAFPVSVALLINSKVGKFNSNISLADNSPTISTSSEALAIIKPKSLIELLKESFEKVLAYFSALSRIFFCVGITIPAVTLGPIAIWIKREDVLWKYITWMIETLGPTFIKLAQWASTRPDLFPYVHLYIFT